MRNIGICFVGFVLFGPGWGTPKAAAADFTIDVTQVTSTNLVLAFPSQTDSYYHVRTTENLNTGSWSVMSMQWGPAGVHLWTSSAPGQAESGYYSILKIPRNNPRDQDGDGLDDVYELARAFLNPLDPADAGMDFDGDGVDNLGEYRRQTDPAGSGSRNVTLYIDSGSGNNSYDGLSPEVLGPTRGPKQDIQAALDAGVSGDSVQMAEGIYHNTTLDPATNRFELVPVGHVQME